MDDLPELRAHVPALEPDDVLLGQLVELSAASTAAASARRKLRPVRALTTGAAALGLVAATTWIAGALPGVPSPIAPHPARNPAPTAPATPSRTSDAHVPGADLGPTSGASRPHAEAPGVAPFSGIPTWTPPGQPTTRPSGQGGGRAVGHGPGKHPDQGRHLGQSKPHRGNAGQGSSGQGSNQSRSGTRGKRHLQSQSPSPASDRRASERPTNDHATGP
jgi:hypothetical protein